MEPFSIREIILIVFGGAGFVSGIIAALTFITGRIDKTRQEKKDTLRQHITQSAEFERIQLDSMVFTKDTFIELIRELQTQIAKLRKEVEECEQHRLENRTEIDGLQRQINEMKKK